MRFLFIVTELTRLLWVLFSLAVLLQFAKEVHDQAGVVTLPYVLACTAISIQCLLVVSFGSDWLAKIVGALGFHGTAERILRKYILAWSKLFGAKGPGTLAKRAHLAELYLIDQKDSEAKELFNVVISQWNRRWWSFLSPACKSLDNYAIHLKKNKQLSESEEIRKMIKGWQLGAILPSAVMVVLVALSAAYLLYVKQIRQDINALTNSETADSSKNARELIDELARVEEKVLGPVAAARLYHGVAWSSYFPAEERDVANSEWSLLRAIPLARKSESTVMNLAESLMWLGEIQATRGESDKAEANYKEAMQLLLKRDNGSIPYTISMDLARLYQIKKDFRRSRDYYVKAASVAEETFGKRSDFYADAQMELAGVEMHLRNYQSAEKAINEACSVAEELYNSELKIEIPSKESYRRLITSLVTKEEVLSELGKDVLAQEVSKHISDVQNAKTKKFKLDAQTQDWIVDTTQELSKCLLSIKFNDRNSVKSRAKLKKLLTEPAQHALELFHWSSTDISASDLPANSLSAIEANFSDINVENPDASGLLTVKVRGTFKLSKTAEDTPFGFYYRLKLEEPATKNAVVYRVAELVSSPLGSE